jgi:hypothetical protein
LNIPGGGANLQDVFQNLLKQFGSLPLECFSWIWYN